MQLHKYLYSIVVSGHYSARIGISLLQLTHVIIDSLETITLANPPHRPFFHLE